MDINQKKYKYIFPIGLFIYNLIDLAVTAFFVNLYGLQIELNPLVHLGVKYIGVVGVILIKIIASLVCSLFIYFTWKDLILSKVARGVLYGVYFAYLLLASHYIGNMLWYWFIR